METNSAITFSHHPSANGVTFLDSDKIIEGNSMEKQREKGNHSRQVIRGDDEFATGDAAPTSEENKTDSFFTPHANGDNAMVERFLPSTNETPPDYVRCAENVDDVKAPGALATVANNDESTSTNDVGESTSKQHLSEDDSGLAEAVQRFELDPTLLQNNYNEYQNGVHIKSSTITAQVSDSRTNGDVISMGGSKDDTECVGESLGIPQIDSVPVQNVDEDHHKPNENFLKEDQSDDTTLRQNSVEKINNLEERLPVVVNTEPGMMVNAEKSEDSESSGAETKVSNDSNEKVHNIRIVDPKGAKSLDVELQSVYESTEAAHNSSAEQVVNTCENQKDIKSPKAGDDVEIRNDAFEDVRAGETKITNCEEDEEEDYFGGFGSAEDEPGLGNEAPGEVKEAEISAANCKEDEENEFGVFGSADDEAGHENEARGEVIVAETPRDICQKGEEDEFGAFGSAEEEPRLETGEISEAKKSETPLAQCQADNEEKFGADEEDEFGAFGSADEDEEDEFGAFGSADGEPSQQDSGDVGESHDGGMGSVQQASEFVKSYCSKEASDGMTASDPIIQNVRTVFSKLFRHPDVELETVQNAEDAAEAITIGEILQNYQEITTEDKFGTAGLKKLTSRVRDVHAQHDEIESVPGAFKVYGHDRNPFVAPLKANNCRLAMEFSSSWSDLKEVNDSTISPQFTPTAIQPTLKDVEEFATLIPDLSFMLSDRLCIPN